MSTFPQVGIGRTQLRHLTSKPAVEIMKQKKKELLGARPFLDQIWKKKKHNSRIWRGDLMWSVPADAASPAPVGKREREWFEKKFLLCIIARYIKSILLPTFYLNYCVTLTTNYSFFSLTLIILNLVTAVSKKSNTIAWVGGCRRVLEGGKRKKELYIYSTC